MKLGVRMLLLHEVLSSRDDDDKKRHACTFAELIENTPKHLIAAKLYETMIALNLAGEDWRKTGLIRAAQHIAKASGAREPRAVAKAEECAVAETKEVRTEVQKRMAVAAKRVAVVSHTAQMLARRSGEKGGVRVHPLKPDEQQPSAAAEHISSKYRPDDVEDLVHSEAPVHELGAAPCQHTPTADTHTAPGVSSLESDSFADLDADALARMVET